MIEHFIIRNKLGTELIDLQSWQDGFIAIDKEPKHWRKDFSAHSLGLFFTKGNENNGISAGQEWVERLIQTLIGSPFIFKEAEIEHASKVDNYRGGQRMQDLAIWGECSGKSVFMAVEAKVLESFDRTIIEAYNNALEYKKEENPRSKKDKRIEDLIARFFPAKLPTDEKVCNLRYQLLHYVAASQQEGFSLVESKKGLNERKQADIVVLPILVFRTPHYFEDEEQAKANKQDYLSCISQIGFEKSSQLKFDGNDVYVQYDGSRVTYSIYAEIDL